MTLLMGAPRPASDKGGDLAELQSRAVWEQLIAIYSILATGADDLEAEFLTHTRMVPVVAANHRLAKEPAPLTREIREQQIQLVVMDRSSLTPNLKGGIYSARIWRFADFSTRLEYLLGGLAGATCLGT
jgi:DNA-binding transcriptional LysR family regulator